MYPKTQIEFSDIKKEIISLDSYGELQSGSKLKMGKSYLYFQKEGMIYFQCLMTDMFDSDYSQHHYM